MGLKPRALERLASLLLALKPEPAGFNPEYVPDIQKILALLPGLTGPGQWRVAIDPRRMNARSQ